MSQMTSDNVVCGAILRYRGPAPLYSPRIPSVVYVFWKQSSTLRYSRLLPGNKDQSLRYEVSQISVATISMGMIEGQLNGIVSYGT